MKISSKVLPQSRRQYSVTITELEVAEFYEQALTRLAATIKVAGFRPGKAPANLIREQIDKEKLREEAYSLAVHEAWHQVGHALKEGERPIQDPAVEIMAFEEGKEGSLTFAFDIRPEVKVGDIKTIKLTGIKKPSVTDKDVTEVLEALSKGHAKTIVKLTPAKVGDKIEVTFDGYLKNVKQEKLSSKHFPIVLGEKSVIPGFAEELIGLKKGDKKKFTLKFPADHFDKELANQLVVFEVSVDEVFDVILPKPDVEFAKKFGHDTIDQLKKAIKTDLETEKQEEFFTQQKAKWLEEFEKKITLELPISLVDAEVGRARANWQEFLSSRNLEPKAWLTQRNMTMEQLEKDWHKAAESSVRIGLGLAELAEQEKKQLQTNEDYQEFLDELVKKAA